MYAWITFDKVVPVGNAKFTLVFIFQFFHQRDTDPGFFKVSNCDGNIYDRFCQHAWDGGATHMLDIQIYASSLSWSEAFSISNSRFHSGVYGTSLTTPFSKPIIMLL